MSRLIDADKLKEGVSSYHFRNLIDDQPTVDIVRCKDCKYWIPTTVESIKDGSYINHPHPCEINCWGNRGEWRTAVDFCSRGERRDEID